MKHAKTLSVPTSEAKSNPKKNYPLDTKNASLLINIENFPLQDSYMITKHNSQS